MDLFNECEVLAQNIKIYQLTQNKAVFHYAVLNDKTGLITWGDFIGLLGYYFCHYFLFHLSILPFSINVNKIFKKANTAINSTVVTLIYLMKCLNPL